MRVALVHDDLIQWGGAERVLEAISEVFPDAPIYTSLFDENNPILKKRFKHKKIITSFMQKIPFFKYLYKSLLPLYPNAFEQFDFSDYDLVISHTTRFAKSVITKPHTTHICYCHTPPRFLWSFSGNNSFLFTKRYFNFLKRYDLVSSKRVDFFLAGSNNAKVRIKKIYKEDSEILYPFVDNLFLQPYETFDGDYYLMISRLNKYKNVGLAVKTFNKNGKRLKIVGIGPELKYLKSIANQNIAFLESVSDVILLNLIAGCKALIITAEEDFGLTSLESQAMGKPVIAYKGGGVLETVIENKTGVFFNCLNSEELDLALEKLEKIGINPALCRKNAQNFTKEIFKSRLKDLTLAHF